MSMSLWWAHSNCQDVDQVLGELFPTLDQPVAGACGSSPSTAHKTCIASRSSGSGGSASARSHIVSGADGATYVVEYPPYGLIAYYEHDRRFQAICWNACAGHGTCKLTRFVIDSAHQPAKGRPCGLMMAWLRMSYQTNTHQEHINRFWMDCNLCLSDRQAGRDTLKRLPGGDMLLQNERPQRSGELEEPAGQP